MFEGPLVLFSLMHWSCCSDPPDKSEDEKRIQNAKREEIQEETRTALQPPAMSYFPCSSPKGPKQKTGKEGQQSLNGPPLRLTSEA